MRVALTTPGLAAALRRCLARLWRGLRLDDLSVRGRVGLGDPCDTGRLFAVLELDSPVPSRFDQVDQNGLDALVREYVERTDVAAV